MAIYNTLPEAVAALAKEVDADSIGGRVYSLYPRASMAQPVYLIACSPAAAALAYIGEVNVRLVPQHERYQAMQVALNDALARHNGKDAGAE